MNQTDLIKMSKQVGVPVKKIWDLFYMLRNGDELENNMLIQKTGIAKSALWLIKEEMDGKLVSTADRVCLSPNIVNEVQQMFESSYQPSENEWNFLVKKEINLGARPKPNRDFDQFHATEETVLRRASLLDFYKDIQGKRVLFLGDDDMTSVATASMAKAERVAVVDIDKRILGAIATVSDSNKLNIETREYDARKAWPEDLKEKFDVVFTDPPYTTAGVKLFLSRAISALDLSNPSARVYVCYGNSDRAKERFLPIYQEFLNMGMMIRQVFDKFNRYEGAESIGSTSSLYILEVTPKTKPIVKGVANDEIYTNN